MLERVFNKRPVRDTLPAVRLRIQDICDEQKKRGNPLREGTTWFLRKVNEFISSRTGDYCTEFIQLLALQDHEKDELRVSLEETRVRNVAMLIKVGRPDGQMNGTIRFAKTWCGVSFRMAHGLTPMETPPKQHTAADKHPARKVEGEALTAARRGSALIQPKRKAGLKSRDTAGDGL